MAPSCLEKLGCDLSLRLLLLLFSIPIDPLKVGDLRKMKEAQVFHKSDCISLAIIWVQFCGLMYLLPHRWCRLFWGCFLACNSPFSKDLPLNLQTETHLFLPPTPAKYCTPSLLQPEQWLSNCLDNSIYPASAVGNTWGPVPCPSGATELEWHVTGSQ